MTQRFRPGDRIKVVRATSWTARNGMRGTVLFTDSQGTVHCRWDGGFWKGQQHETGGVFGITAEEAELITDERGLDDPSTATTDPLLSWPDLSDTGPAGLPGVPPPLVPGPGRATARRLRGVAARSWRWIRAAR